MNPVTADYKIGEHQLDSTKDGIAAVHVNGVLQVLDVKSKAVEESMLEQGNLHKTTWTAYKLVMKVFTALGTEAWVDLSDPNIRVVWVEQNGERHAP